MIKVVITGACGRMGSAVLKLAASDPAFVITHVLEIATHPLVGSAIDVPGVAGASFLLEDSLAHVVDDCDVVIDFTHSDASLLHLRLTSEKGKAIVIGTTGISPETMAEMKAMPAALAVISPNMSIGVNLLFTLVDRAARLIGRDYDTEIIEMHHKWKKDAPSGTAVKLRDIIMTAGPDRQWTGPFRGRRRAARDHASGLFQGEFRARCTRGGKVDRPSGKRHLRHGRRARLLAAIIGTPARATHCVRPASRYPAAVASSMSTLIGAPARGSSPS